MREDNTYRGMIRNFFRTRSERGGRTMGDAMELVQRGWRYAVARMKTDWATVTSQSIEARRQGQFAAIVRLGRTAPPRVIIEEARLACLAFWQGLTPTRPGSRCIRELSLA